jgi:hypothetical protein
MSDNMPTVHHGEPSEPVTLTRKELEALLEVAAERGAERGAKKALQALQQGAPAGQPQPTMSAAVIPIVGEDHPAGVAAQPPASAEWIPEWGTIGQAEGLLARSNDTTVKRVRSEGLGVFRGGRWMVDLARVRAWRDGRPFPPLNPYPQADSVKFAKVR